jgi:hypothetical protein
MPSRLENKLLRHGTFVGPVTPEMVARAKEMYEEACHLCGHKLEKDGWEDFIPEARKELKVPKWKDK